MNLKYLIALAAISGIGYQSYTRFKNFINNIKVSTLNFVKNLDQTFTVDLILANSLMSIIPYKIAEIKLINDNNEIIATAVNPAELDKTTNIQFLMNIPDAILNIGQLRSLDVEITFNFFLFQHVRRYQQSLINENGEIVESAPVTNTNIVSEAAQLIADNTIPASPQTNLPYNYVNNQYTQGASTCSCKPIL